MGIHCLIMKLLVSIATLLATCNCKVIEVSDDVVNFMNRLCYDKNGGRQFVFCDVDVSGDVVNSAADGENTGQFAKDTPKSDFSLGRRPRALSDITKLSSYENEARARTTRSNNVFVQFEIGLNWDGEGGSHVFNFYSPHSRARRANAPHALNANAPHANSRVTRANAPHALEVNAPHAKSRVTRANAPHVVEKSV